MDCWRQWIRHRTANVNEYSTRYSIAIDAISKTKPNDWRLQSSINKQGSEGHLDIKVGTKLSKQEEKLHSLSREIYEERLNADVAREQARKDLPLSTYTEAYWKIDLHNLLHFLSLRMDDHAQHEIRQYANIIGYEIVSKWVPFTWEAFLDYQFISVFFSESETSLLKLIYSGKIDELIHMMEQSGWLKKQDNFWKLNREGSEFAEKLEKIGIKSPWNKQ
jgi:thymidylate synthase (FAD)